MSRPGPLVGACALLVLAGCTDNTTATDTGGDNRTIRVTSTDKSCTLSSTEAPSGNLVYTVKNAGSKVTEFYLYSGDGKRVVGEVENVGPGLSRDLVINVPAGSYIPTCKPGMVGKGIRRTFTVTRSSAQDSAATGASQKQAARASARYKAYVGDQTDELLAATKAFVAAYKAGDDVEARTRYASTRVHWERIEPVAESFGDLDPQMDARQADLEKGQRWTGWHRIEKDLWPPAKRYTALSKAQRASYADKLLADTVTLHGRVHKLGFTVDQIGNGAKGLLDEVAKSKLTGEEEAWSHTDLYDFQANVDGAREAFESLEPMISVKDPTLQGQIERRFVALQRQLDRHRRGAEGFVSHTSLSSSDVRRLSDAVNALSEPLSRLTAAVAP